MSRTPGRLLMLVFATVLVASLAAGPAHAAPLAPDIGSTLSSKAAAKNAKAWAKQSKAFAKENARDTKTLTKCVAKGAFPCEQMVHLVTSVDADTGYCHAYFRFEAFTPGVYPVVVEAGSTLPLPYASTLEILPSKIGEWTLIMTGPGSVSVLFEFSGSVVVDSWFESCAI